MVFGLFKKSEAQIVEKNFNLITSTHILPTNFDILHDINFDNFKTMDDIAEHTKMDKNFIRFIYFYDVLVERRFINLDPGTQNYNYSYQDSMTRGHEIVSTFLLLWHKDTNDALSSVFIRSDEEKMKKYQLLDKALQERGYPFELYDDRSLKKEVKLYSFNKILYFFERKYYKPKERNHFRIKQIYTINNSDSVVEITDFDYDGKLIGTKKYNSFDFVYDERLMQSFNIEKYVETLNNKD